MSGAAGDVLVPPGTIGYLDRVSAGAGETVRPHVSSTAPTWRAELVRLYALEIPVSASSAAPSPSQASSRSNARASSRRPRSAPTAAPIRSASTSSTPR